MAVIDEALIRKVAELSRLKIDDSEIDGYVNSIREILKHVDQLSSVDAEGVEPLFYGIDDDLRLRDDEVIPFAKDAAGKPKVLEHAPAVEDGGFKVPQIIG